MGLGKCRVSTGHALISAQHALNTKCAFGTGSGRGKDLKSLTESVVVRALAVPRACVRARGANP